MAKGLEGHTVSLTKNGYFKLTKLIAKYPSNKILEHLGEISLDFTQARKMLAGDNNDNLPTVWDDVKKYDEEAQYALLLFSIIFSHKDLIQTFKNSTAAEMQGEIKRSDLDVKTYTNLAYALNEAGLAINFTEGAEKTKYDLGKIFAKNEIGPLAKIILQGHLQNMGWSKPGSDLPFQRTFEEQVKFYEFNKVLGISAEQLFDWFEGKNILRKIAGSIGDEEFSIDALKASIAESNLTYSPLLVTRFVSSLLTKPFLILTGLAGSGKTKLAQAFVQWICKDKSQYTLIPVGADWTNREPLLGYPNALKPDEYIKPDSGVLDVIINANSNPELPYFLILDEMNLSHVERYFADFLSVMESREAIPIYAEQMHVDNIPAKVFLPSNLFIVGTVNIDETTNMFSPKVLDRANTIEFRVTAKEIEEFLSNSKPINLNSLSSQGAAMAKSFLLAAKNDSSIDDENGEIKNTMVAFFGELRKVGAEFGYRSATEMVRLINNLTLMDSGLSISQKLDIAIMQKLLPKLHGSRRKLCPVLLALGRICVSEDLKVEKDVFEKDDFEFIDSKVLYPMSLEKISRMYKGAIDNGFASFAEA